MEAVLEEHLVEEEKPNAGDNQRTVHKRKQPNVEEIIPINQNCFRTNKFGKERTAATERKQRYRITMKIVDAISNQSITKEQQVLALKDALDHYKVRSIYCSATGIVSPKVNQARNYILENIKSVLTLLNQTNHKCTRTTDDKRSVIQSIVIATLPSPNFSGKKPSLRSLAAVLGL